MKRRRQPETPDGGHHPNSIYHQSPPDFEALARLYPDFAQYVQRSRSGSTTLDWNDPEALLSLTRTLLLHDFGLQFDIPRHHLCPPVPQRLNYLLWVEDLLTLLPRSHPPIGIDIGTGASAIFALLGSARSMQFLCTEVDPESVRCANDNIKRNKLEDKIEVIQVDDPKKILAGVIPNDKRFDFCVCNPPFFDSLEETGLNNKRVCLATSSELVYTGGELQFIQQLLDESASIFRSQIGWYTTMLGRKITLSKLLPRVHSTKPTCVRTTTFNQGRQTRWGLAWTYRTDLDLRKLGGADKADRALLRFSLTAAESSLDTVHKLISEWTCAKEARIITKSPLTIVVAVPLSDSESSIGIKLSLTPVHSTQVRILAELQCTNAELFAKQLEDIRTDLESLFSVFTLVEMCFLA